MSVASSKRVGASPPSDGVRPGSQARIRVGLVGAPERVDVLVVGLGVTGAGVALDAASRGLSVLAVDAHDLAFGTSRWSSKLAHGGLRYLASGSVGVAWESAVERGILLTRTAPHLVRPLPFLIPLIPAVSRAAAVVDFAGLWAGDALRRSARTPGRLLPRPRRLSRRQVAALAPGVRADARGGLVFWDGQLEDDARLVTALARTAVAHGADVRHRVRVRVVRRAAVGPLGDAGGRGGADPSGGTGQRAAGAALDGAEAMVDAEPARGTELLGGAGAWLAAELRDENTGHESVVKARAVINACGVWADELVDDVRLRPSRGTHLVVRADAAGSTRAALNVAIPGSVSRWVFSLPQADGTAYIGLTDDPITGAVPDVPAPGDGDAEFLLSVINQALARPLGEADVLGSFAGLRPLLDAAGQTADLSRKHAVHRSPNGVITVVGGKLTTYRKMAEDAVDATGLAPGRCVTRDLPLLGATGPSASGSDAGGSDAGRCGAGALAADAGATGRLARRFGAEAELVLATAREATGLPEAELTAPAARGATLAELVFAITHEGARTVEDLLDRRTRVGLVPADRAAAVPLAERALSLVG
ncbi:MAG: glycerol-3-phosphate dehydrogenase/oxidase [Actinomycetia bacterium]|nr:glycerol-3-phosphate dehydrogenase/oxidase [Actinomycetes bacterium]